MDYIERLNELLGNSDCRCGNWSFSDIEVAVSRLLRERSAADWLMDNRKDLL